MTESDYVCYLIVVADVHNHSVRNGNMNSFNI